MTISSVTYDSVSLIVDGKRQFLYSGEIHYFRTDPDQWRDSLEKIKAANLNTISTYIPWNWHEIAQGTFDFTGRTHPRRNLVQFLDIVQELGLQLIFRSGPYICSEWLNGGIPTWLLEKHPEILALDCQGQPSAAKGMPYPPITYAHPTYLEYVRNWYHHVFAVARPYFYSNGGNIINVQLDDEQSYWRTIFESPLLADYNPVVTGDRSHPNRFGAWLREKYAGDLAQLNEVHRAAYPSFADACPPYEPLQNYRELPFFLDWYGFKLGEIDQYIKALYEMLMAEKVDVTISTLDHYLPAMMAWPKFSRFLQKNHLNIIHTSQYYSSPLFGVSDMREDKLGALVASHELYKTSLKGIDTPPIQMEIQSAMSAHLTGPEMEEMYHLSLAQGMNGLNFYMIAGGENHPDFVLTNGRSYDISAPIGYQGQLRPHYDQIQDLGAYLQTVSDHYLKSETLYDVAVGFYEPYEACGYQGNTLELGFRDNYQFLFNEYYQYHICAPRGLDFFSLLTLSGVSFCMENLEEASVEDLLRQKQVWVLGLDFMARSVQKKLVEYAAQGGCLVLFPRVPLLDEFMQPCDILKNLVGCAPIQPEPSRRPEEYPNYRSVNFGDRQGVLMFDYIDKFDPPADAKTIATENRTNKVCAFSRAVEKGKVVLIGFKLKYIWDAHLDHKAFVQHILEEASVTPVAYSLSGELVVRERAHGGTGFLTVINPTNLTQTSQVVYADPSTCEPLALPNLVDGMTFTRQGATTMPLNLELPSLDGKMCYCTAQITSLTSKDGGVEVSIKDEKCPYAEIAIQVPGRITVSVDGAAIDDRLVEKEGIWYIPLQMTRTNRLIRITRTEPKVS